MGPLIGKTKHKHKHTQKKKNDLICVFVYQWDWLRIGLNTYCFVLASNIAEPLRFAMSMRKDIRLELSLKMIDQSTFSTWSCYLSKTHLVYIHQEWHIKKKLEAVPISCTEGANVPARIELVLLNQQYTSHLIPASW